MRAAPRWRLILNGKSAGDEPLREAVHAKREQGIDLSVRVTWEGGDVERYVKEAVTDGVDIVVAAGGDGTVSEVAHALAQHPGSANELPALGLVPMGTANDFATAALLPIAPHEAFALLASTTPQPIDLIQLHANREDRWFINLASGGFGTQVTVETPEGMKRLLGGLAYFLTGLTKIGQGQIEPVPFELKGPDFTWSGGCLALGLGNGRQAGGGQVLCPDALLDDGLLDVTIVPELEGELTALMTAAVTEGKEAALDRAAIRTRLPWLELTSTGAPLVLNLDGEPVEASHFRIECVPQRLRMHLPAGCPLLGRA